jgi:hypothetical protein
MDEHVLFEPRAVFEPRRAGRNRIAILVPLLALVAIAWLGLSDAGSDQLAVDGAGAAVAAAPSGIAAPSPTLPPVAHFPAKVLGLDVHRLTDITARALGPREVIAVAGWYVPTAITNCPELDFPYVQDSPAELPHRVDRDRLAFCQRFGVLYASRPGDSERLPANNREDDRPRDVGPPAYTVSLVTGIRVPAALETIGASATPVVVIVHFDASGDACVSRAGCARALIVDFLGWAGDV